MVMVSGSVSPEMGAACVLGRSTGTPTVRSGAATMNTMSSTSITSTTGVTLISAIGAREYRPRPLFLLPADIAMFQPRSSSWRERIAENSSAKLSIRAPMRDVWLEKRL